ncbi:trace amine-associated receptor 13c-like [Boleophthalmus pectinirostris]|uniref:trace amine-associated receptor 13c-like n=1 Tax=Boleophthalmus pectinirostris TaxID=150288 RepID=UPI0024311A07|nr:trace amine-associated receptor 13c-like [Boleophthalmus pectinirostris]
METVELCFPHLHNSSCIKHQADIFEIDLVSVLLSLLSTITAALNLLVIISISHFRQLHSTTNLILLSLAVSDFLVGLVVIPILATMWKVCWYSGELLCGLVYLVPSTAIMASVGTVVLISVDRYVAICDPLHYPTRMTEKVVGVSISVCWIYAFFYAISVYIDNVINQDKYRLCYGQCMVHMARDANFILAFVIPVTTIVCLYMKVFIMAASQARAIRSNATAVISKTSRKSEIKAARNLGILVLVYLMCYSPYYFVAYSEANILIFGVPIELVSIYLYFLNSCINPLMYAMLYPWFRKAIKLIVTLQILKHGSCDLTIL